MYKAVKINASTLIPEIVDVGFEIRYSERLKSDWIYITRGGITGYESAEIKKLIDNYSESSVFSSWVACAGTLRKYHRLEVPISEIIRFLKHRRLIDVEYKYGYVRKITWRK